MQKIPATDSFNIYRLFELCKRIIYLNHRSWLTGLITAFGILLFMYVAPSLFGSTPWHGYNASSLIPMATFFYVIAGLLMTSRIFDEIHSPTTAFLTLTLPATSLEKLTSAWLVTSLLYTVFLSLLFSLFLLLLQFGTNLIEGTSVSIGLFNPFGTGIFENILLYFSYHPAFLLGSILFKKSNFLKTVLSLIALFIGLTILVAIGFAAFGESDFYKVSMDMPPTTTFALVGQIIFGLILLLFSYIRLKNKQVT